MRLSFKCVDCETESSLKREIEGKKWEEVHQWVDLSEVVGGDGMNPINYGQLVKQLGSRLIDDALLDRFKSVTGHEPHYFLRRRIASSHRDLEVILDKHERKETFFIYAGRGPSSDAMHLGHMVNFRTAKWLSEVFKAPLLVMLSDDEKFLRDSGKTEIDIEGYMSMALENAKDIIAVGCDPDTTFLYSNCGYMSPPLYFNMRRASLQISIGTAWAYFGSYDEEINIGTLAFPATLAAGAFASSYPSLFPCNQYETSKIPCLVTCAPDEDAYLQVTRAITRRFGNAQPSLLHIKYVNSPQAPSLKMSSSVSSSVIFLSDNYKKISEKINLYTSSKDSQALGEPRASMPDPERDVCFQYLSLLLEDDQELDRIQRDYETGKMSMGDMRKKCVDEIFKVCASFQKLRSQVTVEMLDEFMLIPEEAAIA